MGNKRKKTIKFSEHTSRDVSQWQKNLLPNLSQKRNKRREALRFSLKVGLCLLSELQMEAESVEGKDSEALRHQTHGMRENEQRILPATCFKGLWKRHDDKQT